MPIPINETIKTTRPLVRGDEVECAERLLEIYKTRTDHVVACSEILWLYDAQRGVWDAIDQREVLGEAQNMAGMFIGKGKKKRRLRLSAGNCKGVVTLLMSRLDIYRAGFFDDAAMGIAFKDGFVTCEDGEPKLIEHSHEHRARHGVDYYWDPKAKFNNWRSFLSTTFQGDADAEDKRAFLQEFVGACLLGIVTQFRKCIIFDGAGSNGKSVALEALANLFPTDAVTSMSPKSWIKEYYTAKLDGAMLNMVGEAEVDALAIGSEVLKRIVAGDQVSARHPYGQPFEFHPKAGHILSVNGLPEVKDQSKGFWSRFVVLTFNRSFDPNGKDTIARGRLDELLAADCEGMTVWAVKGAARLLQNGCFTLPASSQVVVEDWQLSTDTIRAWIGDKCALQLVEGDKKGTSATDLYRNYKNFCGHNGLFCETIVAFGHRLKALKVEKTRRASGVFWHLNLKAGGTVKRAVH